MSTLGARALGLAVDGFRVIPVMSNGKAPLTEHGCKDASAGADLITAWWRRWPEANVGVATGDGLCVVDVDMKQGVDGEATWQTLQQAHGTAPTTRTVLTPNGGRHLYFISVGASVACSVSRLGPGIDIRGSGGYVVAAGTIGGKIYQTLPEPVATAPAWLLELVRAHDVAGRPVVEWRQLARTGVELGRRNAAVASFAGHLLRKGVDAWVVLELLRGWNQSRVQPPLPDDELLRCVDSIAGRELSRRIGPRS
ncbi:MAG: bifunctional DNA primase/polymerase [Candidatus Dormiibacterota bacterium]